MAIFSPRLFLSTNWDTVTLDCSAIEPSFMVLLKDRGISGHKGTLAGPRSQPTYAVFPGRQPSTASRAAKRFSAGLSGGMEQPGPTIIRMPPVSFRAAYTLS